MKMRDESKLTVLGISSMYEQASYFNVTLD
jgi:hypothetical protein